VKLKNVSGIGDLGATRVCVWVSVHVCVRAHHSVFV